MKRICFCLALALLAANSFSQTATKPKTATGTKPATAAKARLVLVTTDYGSITIKLYDSTPQHRDNFIKLVKDGFYDSLLFHRVISGFMIQGGDPTSKYADSTAMVGAGSAPGDRIPAEFNANYIHKKGVLAAARDNNPEKASSNCQFYIVQGKPSSDEELNSIECNIRQSGDILFRYTDAQRKTYKTIGGTPFLDQNYTVFGEVVKGLDVVEKIAAVATGENDRPLKNVRMKMKMLN